MGMKFELTKIEAPEINNVDIEKVKQGDEKEKEKLVLKFLPLVKKLSKENGVVNEDLMQELLIVLFKKAVPTYKASKKVKFMTYFYGLAMNSRANYYKSKSHRSHYSINKYIYDEGQEEFSDYLIADMDLEEEYVNKDVVKIINNIVNELKAPHKKMIREFYGFNGKEKTCIEIAKEFGCTRQNINQEIVKIRNYIGERLKWEGVC